MERKETLMHNVLPILLAMTLLILPLMLSAEAASDMEYLNDYMRVRGDLSGKEVVYHWTGTAYSYVPNENKKILFNFEGFNIARTVNTEGGYELLTREAAFYLDPLTGKILETWKNPFTGKTVPVVHVWNDPVNQDLTFGPEYLPYVRKMLPSTDLGDQIAFNNEIFPLYDNPLTRKEYGDFSQGDKYQSAEFFQFFVNKADLANKDLTSVPATISWTRISPWLPFMRMGDRPGNLVFVCRGRKLPGGYSELPLAIREYVEAQHPEYNSAPTEFLTPNETSWTYFKKLVDTGVISK